MQGVSAKALPPGREENRDKIRWNVWAEPGRPLHLGATLTSGQSFRWRRDDSGVWWGVVGQSVVACWQAEGQPDSPLFWQTFPVADNWALVSDYFRLEVDLERLYGQWGAVEPHLRDACRTYRGLRILRQPPQECLFGFLCATCNTISKIERSVSRLADAYGKRLNLPEFLPPFYAFPTLEALAGADEAVLRAAMWGYRAPLVIRLARHLLATKPDDWPLPLRALSYSEAHAALTGLHGIGAKLADCICLFCLDKDGAVPVDTHVRQIAERALDAGNRGQVAHAPAL